MFLLLLFNKHLKVKVTTIFSSFAASVLHTYGRARSEILTIWSLIKKSSNSCYWRWLRFEGSYSFKNQKHCTLKIEGSKNKPCISPWFQCSPNCNVYDHFFLSKKNPIFSVIPYFIIGDRLWLLIRFCFNQGLSSNSTSQRAFCERNTV